MIMTRFLLRLSSLAAVLVAVGCGATVSTPPGESDKDGPKTHSTPKAPDYTMTAADIAKEFEMDKATAAKKYQDKIVELDGVVNFITDRKLDAVVTLFGYKADPMKPNERFVMAVFDKPENSKVLELVKGQKLKFRGKGPGEFAGFVSVNGCTVVEAGPDPTIKVSAADLTKAYATDEKAAEEKYKEKVVLVDGVVVEIKKGGFGDTLILEGFDEKSDKPVRVSAGIPAEKKEEFAALKKGDKVKIKGEFSGYYPDGAGHIVSINGARIVK
jgi:hypothetical protein